MLRPSHALALALALPFGVGSSSLSSNASVVPPIDADVDDSCVAVYVQDSLREARFSDFYKRDSLEKVCLLEDFVNISGITGDVVEKLSVTVDYSLCNVDMIIRCGD